MKAFFELPNDFSTNYMLSYTLKPEKLRMTSLIMSSKFDSFLSAIVFPVELIAVIFQHKI